MLQLLNTPGAHHVFQDRSCARTSRDMLPVLAGHTCSEARSCENCGQSPPNIKCDNMAVTSRQNISAAARAFNYEEHFGTEKDNVEGVSSWGQTRTRGREFRPRAVRLLGGSGLQRGQNRSRRLGMSRVFGAICRGHQAVDPLILVQFIFRKLYYE